VTPRKINSILQKKLRISTREFGNFRIDGAVFTSRNSALLQLMRNTHCAGCSTVHFAPTTPTTVTAAPIPGECSGHVVRATPVRAGLGTKRRNLQPAGSVIQQNSTVELTGHFSFVKSPPRKLPPFSQPACFAPRDFPQFTYLH